MRVLIIESDEAFASTLRQALEARGVDVEITADGEDGIRRAQSRPTSAVVLSVELGERLTGGFTWCNRFKRDASLRSIPLLLTSALATEETFEQHRKLKTHADGYLLKPYGPRDLLSWLEPYLPQPPAPADDPATFDLASELLADLEDLVEAKEEPLAYVDILDTDELIADIFDEVGQTSLPGAGDGEIDPTPVEQVLADDAEERGGAAIIDEIDGPMHGDPGSIGDFTPMESFLGGSDGEGDSVPGGFDVTSPGILHASASVQDPPWDDPAALVSRGPAIEAQLAALRADAELSPRLHERLTLLEQDNSRLREDLAGALGASTAKENRLAEIEQDLAVAKADNLTLNARATLLEEELAAALQRASAAESRLEAGSRRREELRASLAATATLLEEASRDEG